MWKIPLSWENIESLQIKAQNVQKMFFYSLEVGNSVSKATTNWLLDSRQWGTPELGRAGDDIL